MTREIKFRAWHETDKCWYNPRFIEMNLLGQAIIHHGLEQFEIIPASAIEQYTGLKDKNGKEIYEGDLIKVSDAPVLKDKTLVVKFGEYYIGEYACAEMSGWLVRVVNSDWTASLLDEVDRCEVIGNIHENPELLEVKNESVRS